MEHYLSTIPQFRKTGITVFILTLAFIVVADLDAETPNKQVKAHRTHQAIEIDGDLTETVWQEAEPIDQFVQIEPHDGKKQHGTDGGPYPLRR